MVRSITRVSGFLAVLFAAVVTLMPSRAEAASPERPRPALIHGIVAVRTDDGARAVPDAVVELVNREGDVLATTTTNDEGRFRFEPTHPGRYIVRAVKRGVGAGRTPLTARPGINGVRVLLAR
ncbi:MAG: carboxypeptidase regulatory-like domain-containing protein [Phycisphaerales bacterium]|nr:carboxypeptidase regulatory-like domain-containing protein [Phycisphaerales bacterium]